jgi:CRP/FNR family transcriptional regulator, cyclic AMP receptor protein
MHDVEFGKSLLRRGWLSRTPLDFQQAFFPICRLRRFAAGETLYAAGDEPGGVFGVVRGSVAVSIPVVTNEMHFVHLFQPGVWFGEASMMTGLPRRVTAVARTDVTVANAPIGSMRSLLSRHPEWWRMIGCLSIELNDFMTASGDDLLIRDPERRCIATILRVCGCRFEDPEADVAVTASLSHEELANMANLARNTVGEILHRLSAQGLVELGYRTISVRDGDALRVMVDGT